MRDWDGSVVVLILDILYLISVDIAIPSSSEVCADTGLIPPMPVSRIDVAACVSSHRQTSEADAVICLFLRRTFSSSGA